MDRRRGSSEALIAMAPAASSATAMFKPEVHVYPQNNHNSLLPALRTPAGRSEVAMIGQSQTALDKTVRARRRR